MIQNPTKIFYNIEDMDRVESIERDMDEFTEDANEDDLDKEPGNNRSDILMNPYTSKSDISKFPSL
jgi:hypothetical protein